MKDKKTKIELVAPAGNFKKMKYALAFGADAVYCGVPDFSLRQRVNDFDLKSLNSGIEYAHKLGKKVYVTLNIFAHERHLSALKRHILWLKKAKPDALIVSDPGVLSLIKKMWPSARVHLSTQANCTNALAVKFWVKQGVERIILAREVTLAEIKKIHKAAPRVELEYFVHGAMCMAYSGRCLLSQFFTGRGANLGDCTQPCRWKYGLNDKIKNPNDKGLMRSFFVEEDDGGSYFMNSRDLCLVEYLQDLKKAGITSFKIEGRAKSIYYVGGVTRVYRNGIDDSMLREPQHDNVWRHKAQVEELRKYQNRGLTTGFLFGKENCEQNIEASHAECGWEFCGEVLGGKVLVHNQIFVGDILEFVPPNGDIVRYKVKKMFDDKMEEISEAHGGQDTIVYLPMETDMPEMTLVRRMLKCRRVGKTGKWA